LETFLFNNPISIYDCKEMPQNIEKLPLEGEFPSTFRPIDENQICTELSYLREKISRILNNRELFRYDYIAYRNFAQENYLDYYIEKFLNLTKISYHTVFELKRKKGRVYLDDTVKYILYGNNYYKFIIETVITEIKDYLIDNIGSKFRLKVFVVTDIEIEKWREIVFSIKLIHHKSDDLFEKWDEIGDLIKNKVLNIRKESDNKEVIDEIYKMISIEFEE